MGGSDIKGQSGVLRCHLSIEERFLKGRNTNIGLFSRRDFPEKLCIFWLIWKIGSKLFLPFSDRATTDDNFNTNRIDI